MYGYDVPVILKVFLNLLFSFKKIGSLALKASETSLRYAKANCLSNACNAQGYTASTVRVTAKDKRYFACT